MSTKFVFLTCWILASMAMGVTSTTAQSLPGIPDPTQGQTSDELTESYDGDELGPQDRIWLARVKDFEEDSYQRAVKRLLASFEETTGKPLTPGEKHRVGIKVYTNSGAGLRTSPKLVNALVDALLSRGYHKQDLFMIDLNTDSLWRSGYISSRADRVREYNGVPVYALDEGTYYDANWFYDSPLPSQYLSPVQLKNEGGYDYDVRLQDDRKSYLPVPLLLDVDFWINLPVVSDHPDLGINGVMANATLWNVSNQYRFMSNMAGASAAIAEIAAIPELRRGMVFSIVSLEKIQFMGGPIFNSNYVRTFNEIYLSSNPVALDRIFLEKLNRARETMGFSAISPFPPVFEYARSLNLGDFERDSYVMQIVQIN